jgi:iron complex transport system ATP-binding protein
MTDLLARDVTCRYGDHTVLEHLSLSARAGELLVLLGPNGSGKTTLLRTLARLLEPASGTVYLAERDIREFQQREYARQVALAPQAEQRDWPLTVVEAVQLGRAPHRGWLLPMQKEDWLAIDQAIRDTGLEPLRERPITELSGGEWRRMVIARALALQANVLLLDEPTSGLDLRYQLDVLQLVRQLARQTGLTVVMTLHDLNLASLFADRVAMLTQGRVATVGSPQQVLNPEQIGQTFGVLVHVIPHPIHATPLIVPICPSTDSGAETKNAP